MYEFTTNHIFKTYFTKESHVPKAKDHRNVSVFLLLLLKMSTILLSNTEDALED